MKPTLPLIACAFALPLAACDKGPDVSATNATPSEVQEKLTAATTGSDGVMVQPGRWEGAMTIKELDIPNMPAQAKEQMKAHMAGAKSFVSCVTEEDVKAQKAFFTGDEQDKSCKYDHFTLSGGKLGAVMHCDRGAGAGKMSTRMSGGYSADSYQMDMSSKAEGGSSPMGTMTMKMTVQAKRVGTCKGTPDES